MNIFKQLFKKLKNGIQTMQSKSRNKNTQRGNAQLQDLCVRSCFSNHIQDAED